MPAEIAIWDESYSANADLSTHQFKAVEFVTGGKVDLCNAATDRAVGILQNKPAAANRAARVRHIGISQAVSDGTVAIAAGDPLTTGATGKVVKNTTADRPILGYALEPSTADGTIIAVALGLPGLAAFRTPA